jgi:hypothetical protein
MTAKTRSISSWTMSVFSSTVNDLVLIYESAVSSGSVVRWLTLHSWTLTQLNHELPSGFSPGWITTATDSVNYVSSFYNSGTNWIEITMSNSSRYYVLFRCCGNVC